jgi:hypothetical protein
MVAYAEIDVSLSTARSSRDANALRSSYRFRSEFKKMRPSPFWHARCAIGSYQFSRFFRQTFLESSNRSERLMAGSVNDGTKKTPGVILWRPFPEMPKWQREMERMFGDLAKTICPPQAPCEAGNRDAATERRKTAIIKIAK